MSKQAIELLKLLGVDKSTLETLQDEEKAAELDLKALSKTYTDTSKEKLKEVLKNDGEFISSLKEDIEKSVKGQIAGTQHGAFKRAGLTKEEVESAKSIDDMIALLAEKHKQSGSKDVESLQKELMEANRKYQELQEVEIPKIRQEEKSRADKLILDNKILEHFNTIDAGRLIHGKHDVAYLKAVKAMLNEEYDVKLDEAQNIALYQKGSDKKVPNSNGTDILSFSEAFESHLSPFLKQSNGKGEGAPAGGSPSGTPAGNGKPINPALEKAIEKGSPAAKALADMDNQE